jgi:hypothetical protein
MSRKPPARPETCQCAWNCGRPVHRLKWGKACYDRWTRAGRPAAGPPPPMPQAQRRAVQARIQRGEAPAAALALAASDTADRAEAGRRLRAARLIAEGIAEERRRAAARADPEARVARAKPVARDLIRAVALSDPGGVEAILARITDWAAIAVVLAECADPARAAAATAPALAGHPATSAA